MLDVDPAELYGVTTKRLNEAVRRNVARFPWVARMLGHAGLEMIFKHYGKYIRNRSRKDGGRFLEGLKEAEASAIGLDGNRPGR